MEIKEKTLSIRKLSPLSKRHLESLLDHYENLRGEGLPRGMALSAILSDFMMAEFDSKMRASSAVYFYGRYVDDIVIITNLTEDKREFIEHIKRFLPTGLELNKNKESIHRLLKVPRKKCRDNSPKFRFCFEYLGYQFSVFDPPKKHPTTHRPIKIEIALSKVKKIKLRINRSFLDFQKTKETSLLIDRIKYLTSNFSITDKNTGKRKLAGIFYSYPLLPEDAQSLVSLDHFLKNAILSKKGRVFAKSSPHLTSSLKRKLLAQSFRTGHINREYIHFTPSKINQIQACWVHG